MMELRTFRERPSLLEHTNRIHQSLSVGQGARHDNASLSDDLRTGRDLTNFCPALFNERPLAQCPIAVSQHRQLVARFRNLAERLEFLGGQLPLLLTIEGQAIEFANCWHGRGLVHQFLQYLRGVSEAVLFEMFRCLGETTLNTLTASVGDGLRELGTDLLGEVNRGRVRSTPGLWSNCWNYFVIDDLDDDSFFNTGVAGRSALGVSGTRFLIVRRRRGPSGRSRGTLRIRSLNRISPRS